MLKIEAKRQEIIEYLMSKSFTRKAAETAANNYIETKKFLAEEFQLLVNKNAS